MPELSSTSIKNHKSLKACALILCFVLTTTSACSRASGNKDYFPLADGATWEYTGHFFSASGREFNIRATAKVNGEIQINGKRYYKFVTTADFSGMPGYDKQIEDVRYYRFAKDGIYFRHGNDPDKPDLLEMPLPISVGVKWLSGTTEVRAERAGTVKAGNREFNDCLKLTYKQSDGLRTTENYHAPGVGIIKTVYVNTTEPKSTSELILEKYHL